MPKPSLPFQRLTPFQYKIIIGVLLIVILAGAYAFFFRKGPNYQFVEVKRGSITELVSVTGNTAPSESVSLGFGSSGNIARVYSAVGRTVRKGAVLATLNTADLDAQVLQAKSNLTKQLAENQNTTINVDQVRAEQDRLMKNAYTKLLSSDLVAVPSSSSEEADPPTITGLYDGPEGAYKLIVYHGDQLSSDDHTLYTFDLEKTGPTKVLASEPTPLGGHGLYVSFGNALTEYDDTTWYITIPNTKSSSYLANYNAYQAALKARDSAIEAAEAQIKNSGGTTVAEAQIENARAALASTEAKLSNSRVVAPIDGVITVFDAKVGQYASAGTALISIISKDAFEVEAQVSETDVGKVAFGNAAAMTLDAFPGEEFKGLVFYIDPAQTSAEGVVGYKIKVAFDKTDSRMKSGLTANLDIATRRKDNVLYLPQYAILETDEGTYVETLESGQVVQHPVELGIGDQEGNVEIVSGATEGEEVLNIGLRVK